MPGTDKGQTQVLKYSSMNSKIRTWEGQQSQLPSTLENRQWTMDPERLLNVLSFPNLGSSGSCEHFLLLAFVCLCSESLNASWLRAEPVWTENISDRIEAHDQQNPWQEGDRSSHGHSCRRLPGHPTTSRGMSSKLNEPDQPWNDRPPGYVVCFLQPTG